MTMPLIALYHITKDYHEVQVRQHTAAEELVNLAHPGDTLHSLPKSDMCDTTTLFDIVEAQRNTGRCLKV